MIKYLKCEKKEALLFFFAQIRESIRQIVKFQETGVMLAYKTVAWNLTKSLRMSDRDRHEQKDELLVLQRQPLKKAAFVNGCCVCRIYLLFYRKANK